MNSKNFTIGVLTTTSAILLVGVLLMGRLSDVAHAGPMTVSGGDYTLAVGHLNTRDELLYVIDAPTQRLGMYKFDSGAKKIVLVAGQDLGAIRNRVEGGDATAPTDPNQVPQDPRNRRPDRRRRP
jgi:hypothetical protein